MDPSLVLTSLTSLTGLEVRIGRFADVPGVRWSVVISTGWLVMDIWVWIWVWIWDGQSTLSGITGN